MICTIFYWKLTMMSECTYDTNLQFQSTHKKRRQQAITRKQPLHSHPIDLSAMVPLIYKEDPRPCISFSIMASLAMKLKLEVLGFFADLKQTQSKCVNDILGAYSILCMFNFTCSHSKCRWHTHLQNQSYFDYRETQRPPIWAPWWAKNNIVFLKGLQIWNK